MDSRNKWTIKEYLQDKAIQKRIQQDITRGRDEATVTISRAAELFDLNESRLRDWEEAGLLTPIRPTGPNGRRLYTLNELSKLAVIRELIRAGFAPRDIPPNIYEIWHTIYSDSENQHLLKAASKETYKRISIDHRVEDANKEEFWRYFASQALRMSLNLICEDIPDPVAGIILPIKRKKLATILQEPKDLEQFGECLIGWRDQNHAHHAFYDPAPFFDYDSDFRIRPLRAKEQQGLEDNTFIVLQRKTKPLFLHASIVNLIRRLLTPIYEDVDVWQPYFDTGMRDVAYPTFSFGSTSSSDSILTSLADMVVRLGGKTAGENRWKFCCILLPRSEDIPLQQRTLVVQAQSKASPHTVNKTFVSPETPFMSLSLRAFQSGHMMYRPQVSSEDVTIVYRDLEEPMHSAISVPIAGEDGLPVAVLYVVSQELGAFNEEDQHVLSLVGRMIGELLTTFRIRQQSEGRLRDTITQPRIVDRTFSDFDSENRFIKDVESLLHAILEKREEQFAGEATSFISIDIDNQTNVTYKYGDHASRNLSKALGDRIREQVGLLFAKQSDCKIYYSYADRFYLMLNGKSLEETREIAETLRQALKGSYAISVIPRSIDQPGSKVDLKDITVRLAVSSYKHTKLLELLHRYPAETRIADVRAGNILYYLDVALNMGKQEGGDAIFSYYPPKPPKYPHSGQFLWSPPRNEDLQENRA